MAIAVSTNLALVHEILARYGIPADWLEVVPSVQNWCIERGVPESNPFRAAKCFVADGRCHIVIQNEQTDTMIQSAKELMEFNGFEHEVARLSDDTLYLRHLILHEVACFKLNTSDQDSRDSWAFNELHVLPQ